MRSDFKADCVKAIEKELHLTFKKIQGSSYVSIDENAAIVCAISKDYQKPSFRYWYSFHPYQANFLAKYKQGFVVLGCGSPENIFAIPFREFKPWIEKLNTTERKDGTYYYHIRISVEANGFYLQFQGRGKMEDITRFRLKDLSADAEKPPSLNDPDIHEDAATEGRRRLVLHLQRERNQAIVRKKKNQAASLACEVCSFSFSRCYGSAANDYCEVHHLLLLSEVEHTTQTRMEDLAILCANCHRVVHLHNPPYTLDEVKNMIKA
jgi:hypothetical protein